MKIFYLAALVCGMAGMLQAQPLEALFGRTTPETIRSSTSVGKGGAAFVGEAQSGPNGGRDIYFLLVGSDLEKISERYIGRGKDDGAYSIVRNPGGGFLVAGYTQKPKGGKTDGWVLALDSTGRVMREVILGSPSDDVFRKISTTPGGQVLVAGNLGDYAWVVMLDAAGNTLWEWKHQCQLLPTTLRDAALLPDGTIALAGSVLSEKTGRVWTALLTPDGKLLREQILLQAGEGEAVAVSPLPGGRLALAGSARTSQTRSNGFFARLDPQLNLLSWETFGGREEDYLSALIPVPGGFVASGYGKSFLRGSRRDNGWLVLLDSLGRLREETYPGSQMEDAFLTIALTPSRRLLAAGFSERNLLMGRQGWVFQPDFKLPKTREPVAVEPLSPVVSRADGLIRGTYIPVVFQGEGVIQAVITDPLTGEKTAEDWLYPGHPYLAIPAGFETGNLRFFQNGEALGQPIDLRLTAAENAQPETSPVVKKDDAPYLAATWIFPNPDQFDRTEIVWPEKDLVVQVKVLSNQPLTAADLCIEVNGVPCSSGAKFDEVLLKGSSTYEQKVELREGMNTIRATVVKNGMQAVTEELKVVFATSRPNLHILSIGVPAADLKYTSKDARDFSRALLTQNQTFEAVFVDTLLSEAQTTKTEILKSLRKMGYRYENKQLLARDLLVVFISSHGLTDDEGRFRIAASDYDSPFAEETSLDFEEELIQYLENLPCRKVFFIDACHSGAGVPRLADGSSLAGLSAGRKGFQMLLSCRAGEYSYEDEAWQNGAFTEGLLELTGSLDTGDQNGDGQVDLAEIFHYLEGRVPELVEQKKNKTRTEQNPLLILEEGMSPPVLISRKK